MNLRPEASLASHTTVSETELASASAHNGRREEATNDRLCDDLYDLACHGKYFGLRMTEYFSFGLPKAVFLLLPVHLEGSLIVQP